MSQHLHCWWCGHTIEMSCGYARVGSTTEPDLHLCHGDDHDCYAAALEAREANTLKQTLRHALGV